MTPGEFPQRPPLWEERISLFLLRALAPGAGAEDDTATPDDFAPFEQLEIPRRQGGALSATFYFAKSSPTRGAVLLLHPWLGYGKAYFHRRGRIAALRRAGYHVLTPDLSGFGRSPEAGRYFDLDIEDALAFLRRRSGILPVHLWGVSAGGHWSHPVLSRAPEVRAAFFEDVSPHLLEWSWRTTPWGRPFFLIFRTLLRRAYRYSDMRRHAPALVSRQVAYVVGGRDPGIPVADAEALAQAAGARLLVVPEAGHLGSIKIAQQEIVDLALELFARAEAETAGRASET